MSTPEIAGLTDLHELGRGGFGVVYRAHQAAFGRDVAVKVIPGGGVDDDAVRRFERECRATGAVSGHPNIVRVHDAGVTADGDPYLVMDLLPGGTLADRVRRDGPIPLSAAVALGVALAGALETAHQVGIVHRDVKPENVLFSAFGDAQLVDFGIARMQNAFESRTGSVSATLAHAAPEVIAGADASSRSDLYSLGSVLFYALTGETAFGRASESSLLPLINRITSEPVPDLRTRGVPDAVALVIERAMAKSPEERFGSAAEMGEALREAAASLDLPTMPVPIAAPVEPTVAVVSVPAEETDLTSIRKREVVEAVELVPPAAGVSRGRMVALGATALAVVAALVAVVLVLQDDRPKVVDAGSTTTTSSTTSTTDPASTTEPPTTEPSTTLPVVVPPPETTTSSTTSPRRTTTTTSTTVRTTTTTDTTKPIAAPGPVTNVRASDPLTVLHNNGDPQTIRVTLTWGAPANNGGSGPTQYRMRCTLMQGASPYTGPGTGGCKGGKDFAPVTATSAQPVVERSDVESVWVRWEVTAVNEAGDGPSATADGVMPDLVGLKSWVAFQYGRVVGASMGGAAPRDCGRSTDSVCDQSEAPGRLIAGGTPVAVSEQS